MNILDDKHLLDILDPALQTKIKKAIEERRKLKKQLKQIQRKIHKLEEKLLDSITEEGSYL